MNQDRRKFIKTASATLALTAISGNIAGCKSSSLFGTASIKEFGLQLYTLRDALPKDPKGILKQVAAMGYKKIESYEGDLGMFWGMKSSEFKKCMDDLGMKLVASHCDHEKNLEKKADEAAEIGMDYLLCPWIGPKKTLDPYKASAESFNKAGEICKQRGIKFGYHNHDYSFKKIEGMFPQDVIMQITDKSLVEYEMDMYWVTVAGQDPVEWLRKYPGRFTLSHVKNGKDGKISTLGAGSIDYPAILKEAEKSGMKHFMVEQDDHYNISPIENVKANADYMKRLKI